MQCLKNSCHEEVEDARMVEHIVRLCHCHCLGSTRSGVRTTMYTQRSPTTGSSFNKQSLPKGLRNCMQKQSTEIQNSKF
jgi:hypothetical protein